MGMNKVLIEPAGYDRMRPVVDRVFDIFPLSFLRNSDLFAA